MAITKEKKKEITHKIEGIIKDSKSLVFVNFHGLPVSDMTTMRGTLREKGLGMFVTKKTLAKRAMNDAKLEGELPELPGELALAYGADLLAPAREVFEFQKKHKEALTILGGVFEGRYMDKTQMMDIALIPPLQTLYGQFVNLINSPLQRFAVALDQIAQKKA